jgi:hypothetical protein
MFREGVMEVDEVSVCGAESESLSKKANLLRETWNLSRLLRRDDLSGSPGDGQKFSPFESKVIIAGVSCRLERFMTGPTLVGSVKHGMLPFVELLTTVAPWASRLGEIGVISGWEVRWVSPATFRQGEYTWKDKRNMICVNNGTECPFNMCKVIYKTSVFIYIYKYELEV